MRTRSGLSDCASKLLKELRPESVVKSGLVAFSFQVQHAIANPYQELHITSKLEGNR
jgi:hypothetical protein